jgi:hypothetical protein
MSISSGLTKVALAVCISCGIPPAMAFHPLITDDTGTQGMGGNQLEIGYDHERIAQADIVEKGTALPLTYSRGVTDSLDVFIGTARQVSPSGGWSNVGVGAKWRFYDNPDRGLSMGVVPNVDLPVSTAAEQRGLGSSKISYSVALLLTQETPFGQLLANVVAGRDDAGLEENAPDRKDFWRVSVAPVWRASDRVNVALDMGALTDPDLNNGYWMGFVEIGTVYSATPTLDLSLGVVHFIADGPIHDTNITAGLAWRF